MTFRTHICIFLLLLCCTLPLRAQSDTLRLAFSVQGVVVDADNGRAIESALVSIPGSNNSTVTNSDGKFTIKSAEPFSSVQVSFLGYKTYVCEASLDKPLRIRLQPESYALEGATIISGDAYDLVCAAIRKIPDNYSSKPELLECFYRETVRKRTRYT